MDTVLKAAAAYLIALIALRVVGRRTASQAAPFDIVVLFLFGAMTGTAIMGQDRSFTAAMTGLFTVGLMHVFVGWLKLKSTLIERLVDGTPIVVFRDGAFVKPDMRHLRMQEADIHTAMRQQGMVELDAMKFAVVERDGKISIIPKEESK
ncbi:MAG: DUF421 domain-containing protein [Janthinobacterium lividum]